MDAYVQHTLGEARVAEVGYKWVFFCIRCGRRKYIYPPKVKGTQVVNLHSGSATAGGWMLMARFLMQFSVKKE